MRTYNMEQRGDQSRYYYLYKQIRRDILSGELKRNEKLPSKRSLAEHLGLSLITVENAYQLLKDEGYIETRERSGYYVCEVSGMGKTKVESHKLNLLPLPNQKGISGETQQKEGGTSEGAQPFGVGMEENVGDGSKDSHKDFDMGETPDRQQNMPYSLYFKTIRSVITEYGESLMEKSPGEGCAILRNAIARYLLRYRGIFAQPEQIIIGSGSEHLYSCVVRMLGADKVYAIEDPSYSQIARVYESSGANLERLPMGKDGIQTEALAATAADVLHVTPFHSFPSGVTASAGKRSQYLSWAAQGERYIVEDDFDSEFFMPGKPIETLYAMDRDGAVIYINTFSNSLSPSIRMGYMILPEKLLAKYQLTNGGFSCTVPVLEQYALAEFIDKGYFEQHLNRIRRKRNEKH